MLLVSALQPGCAWQGRFPPHLSGGEKVILEEFFLWEGNDQWLVRGWSISGAMLSLLDRKGPELSDQVLDWGPPMKAPPLKKAAGQLQEIRVSPSMDRSG